jgi:transposase
MYIEEKMTPAEIAIQLQVSPSTVTTWFHKYKIRFRKKMMDKEKRNTVLCELYLKQKWDIPQIANELNVTPRTVEKWLNKLGISCESKRKRKQRFIEEELLSTIYFLYWKKGMSLEQTAQEMKVSVFQVFKWMEKLNIPRRGCGRPTKK